MAPTVQVQLDSYRWMQNAQPISCYVCDHQNTYGSELCRNCYAPMALAHQANANKVRPNMLAVLGASGAGKTVYLGMLMDMLSRQEDSMKALTRGAFSIALQQETTKALSESRFPEKTPCEADHWNWIHCQIRTKRKRALELVVPDLAGEAIMEEAEHANTFPVVRSLISKCSGVLLLVDSHRLQMEDKSQDFAMIKMLTIMAEQGRGKKSGIRFQRKKPLPIAVVFTKADQCENCFDDPQAFAEDHAPGTLRYCAEQFPNHEIFATGVAGACAFRESLGEGRQRIPLRIEPRGIIEPMQWMMQQLGC